MITWGCQPISSGHRNVASFTAFLSIANLVAPLFTPIWTYSCPDIFSTRRRKKKFLQTRVYKRKLIKLLKQNEAIERCFCSDHFRLRLYCSGNRNLVSWFLIVFSSEVMLSWLQIKNCSLICLCDLDMLATTSSISFLNWVGLF